MTMRSPPRGNAGQAAPFDSIPEIGFITRFSVRILPRASCGSDAKSANEGTGHKGGYTTDERWGSKVGVRNDGARIHGIAVKALLLDPGKAFAVRVKGDRLAACRAIEQIEQAIAEQYIINGSGLFPALPSPDEIALRLIAVPEAGHHIVECERLSEA